MLISFPNPRAPDSCLLLLISIRLNKILEKTVYIQVSHGNQDEHIMIWYMIVCNQIQKLLIDLDS
jgi:hypothetical protein